MSDTPELKISMKTGDVSIDVTTKDVSITLEKKTRGFDQRDGESYWKTERTTVTLTAKQWDECARLVERARKASQ